MEGGGAAAGSRGRGNAEKGDRPPPRRSARLGAKSSAPSVSSTKTTSSVARLRESELQGRMEAAALEEKVEEATREIELLEHHCKALIDQLEEVRGREGVPPEEDAAWKKEIKGLQTEIRRTSNEVAQKRINLKYLGKHVDRKKGFLEEQREIDRLRIEEDDNLSQNLSGEEVSGDEEDYLSLLSVKQVERSPSPNMEEMLRRLRRLRGDESPPLTTPHEEPPVTLWKPTAQPSPPPAPQQQPAVQESTTSAINTLAVAFAEAMKNVATGGREKEAKTDKFIARQAIKMDLTPFDGNPEEWPIFISQFQSVSDACGLTPVENLQRLQRGLKGEARECVRTLLLSPDNVEKIVKVLGKRYGDPEVVVQRLLHQAQQLNSVKEGDYGGILKFADVVRNLAATAVSMKCTPFLTNPQLLTELIGKLPVPLQVDWTKEKRRLQKTFADLKDLADWLEDLSEVYVKLYQPSASKKNVSESSYRRGKAVSVMMAAEESTGRKKSPAQDKKDRKCLYCRDGEHFIAACKGFKSLALEDRWKWVREKNHCFACLHYGHSVAKCHSKKECRVDECTRIHHQLLHKKEEAATPVGSPAVVTHATVATLGNDANHVNLMVVPVVLRGPAGEVKTFAMMDTGSTVTLLDDSLAKQLGLQGTPKKLSFKGLHPTVQHEASEVVDFEVRGLGEKMQFKVKGARTLSNLQLPHQSVRRKTVKKWKHLNNVRVETYEDGQPKLLIGQDNVDLILARKVISGPPQAPVAVFTKLGWTLCGKVNHHLQGDWTFHINEADNNWDELHQLVKGYMSLESMGVKVTSESGRCKEDKLAQSIMDTTIKKLDGGWEAGLLWKEEEIKLPSSKTIALTRLQQMERRMDRDPEFRQKYLGKIEEYVQKGFARRLTSDEASVEGPKTFYLPHFMARNPKKPKKLRFVFDAAAKVEGTSLNDKLLKGPDQLRSLPAVLMKFRQKKIGMTADIQDMFHRVKLVEHDKMSQRFLWRGDERDKQPEVYEMGVLIFGATCSPSIAQEVKNKNALEFQNCFPEAVAAILEKFYVDDYLDCCNSTGEAIPLLKKVIDICQEGGFRLCNWICSSKEVMAAIPEVLRAAGHRNLDMENEGNMERVLGMFWLPEADKFTFSLNFVKAKEDILLGKKLPTKREFLSLLMTIYDPLGLVANFVVKAKIMLQATWKTKVGWNDDIPTNLIGSFQRWVTELKTLPEYGIPRCYSQFFTEADCIDLHIFCDASEEAFGCVGYFRIEKNGEVEVAFVSAKSRVAPLKSHSIPRLELLAAVLGTRLAQFIKESHEVTIRKTVYWSDSRTVLCWVTSDGKRYQAFVAHRVGEIQEATEPGEWRWVPTAENVADELTRLEQPSEFSPSSRWVNGPSFLMESEASWPKLPSTTKADDIPQKALEVKAEYIGAMIEVPKPFIDYGKCATWNKLVRRMGQVIRFLKIYYKKDDGPLCPTDTEQAERYWWRVVQRESFPVELECLRAGKAIPSDSRLKTLSVVLDDKGILRLRGRLEKAKCMSEEAKSPVILDNRHPLTRLLIQHHHERGGHHGMERVVNELRQRVHILNIRAAVRSVWSSCQQCKNQRAKPEAPEMAVLPEVRLTGRVSPFTNCGVDYFGPMEVTVGRHHEKRYDVLFTCLSTRAVHLEIAHSLSTDSCIMALRRFFSRRGCPSALWSDNGTNFRGAATELKKALLELSQQRLKEECCNNGVSWKFIPPAAPHMGGSWERLVKSVKVALHATLNQRFPTDEVLLTLMTEAEHTVNSRSLTHVPVDPGDPEALTPNHFLLGRSSNVRLPGVFGRDDLCLRKQWRKAQALTDMFWTRWVKEFLPTLINREKWRKKTAPLKIGDVVLEVDPGNSRNSWPMGIVQQVYPGSDGQVRVADVKFSSGVLRRPVIKLARLDVHKDDEAVGFVGGEEAVASSRAGECRRPERDESSSDRFVYAAGGQGGSVLEEEQGRDA